VLRDDVTVASGNEPVHNLVSDSDANDFYCSKLGSTNSNLVNGHINSGRIEEDIKYGQRKLILLLKSENVITTVMRNSIYDKEFDNEFNVKKLRVLRDDVTVASGDEPVRNPVTDFEINELQNI